MTPSRRRTAVLRSGALAGLAAAGWALSLAGEGPLTIPFGSAEQLSAWMRDTSPPLMAVALLRLAAVGGCAYLGAVLALFVVADAAGWRRLAAAAARALPATFRRTALGGAQLSFAVGAVLTSVSPVAAAPRAPGDDRPPATATMSRLDGTTERPQAPPPIAVMVHLGPADPSPAPDEASSSAPILVPSVQQPPMDPAVATTAVDTWVVGTGDSFWTIAETLVADASRTDPPSEGDIARYWRQLIAANRDHLVAPDHPDLLIPGQVLVVPPPA